MRLAVLDFGVVYIQHSAMPEKKEKLEKKPEYVNKDVACLNVDVCKIWTKITVAKNTALGHKEFLCGFCAQDRDAVNTREIARLRKIIDEKIDGLKATITNELDKFKTDLAQPSTSSAAVRSNPIPPRNTSLNVIVTGMEEETGTWGERQEMLKNNVCTILQDHQEVAEDVVADYRRIGKYMSERRRPIIVTLRSVWTKRKVLAQNRRIKESGRNLGYRVSEDRPLPPAHRKLRAEAWRLNEEIRRQAEEIGTAITTSYSARSGKLVKFVKQRGRWHGEEVDRSDSGSEPDLD